MAIETAEKRRNFHEMHREGCFLLPNPWDLGSLRRLEAMGFRAVASTSSGLAWTRGRKDYELDRATVLAHLAELAGATDLPVNADFENGFAEAPEGVAESVALAVATGIAGLSIEDAADGALYERDLAVARIAAARAAIDAAGGDTLLVARSEAYLVGRPDLAEVIARLTAFAEAGADCLYAPGMTDLDEIAETVRAVAPKPINVLMRGPDMRVADLAARGVRRVSVGGALAAAAWAGFDAAARLFQEEGRVPPRR
ncbi:isocitrate lyase/PEP mutase family protein [Prosthecodimorpha staleyi]|uniref:Isocitrate lyase/phosphoenolpyruvate mutase family protein n=1 Tax=Prosthecodimorpha staleyi TaxID=2840188 RepID=A0A947CZL9_9HYPH|nr:isocitrate lyase/phosphoenolpyruvate mutase family protein [Prosthecodimorpha staleyi]MBT9288208.1 isocitrate lyase/phosphoenolpyruvate mutase family protein [Prosthecodimorpha staleyi]